MCQEKHVSDDYNCEAAIGKMYVHVALINRTGDTALWAVCGLMLLLMTDEFLVGVQMCKLAGVQLPLIS
jgi:hypothetical protein